MNPKFRRCTAVASLLAFSLPATGCTDLAERRQVTGPAAVLQSARYTGEQLYQGLMLGWGPVAEAVPLVRDHMAVAPSIRTAEDLRLTEDVQARIVAAVKQTDPTFFTSFASQIRTGDHVVVAKALRDAGAVTLRALRTMPEIQQVREDLAKDEALQEQVREALTAKHGGEKSTAELSPDEMTDLVLAYLLDFESVDPHAVMAGIFVLAFIAVAAVIAVTWVAVVNWAAGVQVAVAVAAVATKAAVVDFTDSDKVATSTGRTLFHDQLIDAIATWAVAPAAAS